MTHSDRGHRRKAQCSCSPPPLLEHIVATGTIAWEVLRMRGHLRSAALDGCRLGYR